MRFRPALGALAALAVIAGACTGSPVDDEDAAPAVLTVTAPEFPSCLNPLTECTLSRWLHWGVLTHVLPRAMELLPDGRYVASPVLAGEPEVVGGLLPPRPDFDERADGRAPDPPEGSEAEPPPEAGGEDRDSGDFDPTLGFGAGEAEPGASTTTTTVVELPDDPLTVTYRIDPAAAWSDGTPISSADFEFTWRASLGTAGSFVTAGYDRIFSIDTPDSKTAVVTFLEPYAAWRDLFGGYRTYLLPAHAFTTTDLATSMQADLPVGAGPWNLAEFSATQIRLVANDAYWAAGRRPRYDEMKIVGEPAAADGAIVADLRYGTVIEQPPGTPVGEAASRPGAVVQAAWFNADRLDVDQRRGLAFVISEVDLRETMGPLTPRGIETCAPWASAVTQWCPDAHEEIGSEARAAAPGLALSVAVPEGDRQRLSVADRVVDALRAAGVMVDLRTVPPEELFGVLLRQGDFDMAIFGTEAAPDPSLTARLSCEEIPTPANRFAGQNFGRWCNSLATELMEESDRQVDRERRRADLQQVSALIDADPPFAELYQPIESIWFAAGRFGPEIGRWVGSHYGPYHGLYAIEPPGLPSA